MNPLMLLPMVAGAVYIGSCEFRASGPNQCDQQWIAGFALMGIGPAAGAGFEQGYWRLNPELRKPEDVVPVPEPEPIEPIMPPVPPDEWEEIERLIAEQEQRNAPETDRTDDKARMNRLELDLRDSFSQAISEGIIEPFAAPIPEHKLTTAERMARAAARLHSKKP